MREDVLSIISGLLDFEDTKELIIYRGLLDDDDILIVLCESAIYANNTTVFYGYTWNKKTTYTIKLMDFIDNVEFPLDILVSAIDRFKTREFYQCNICGSDFNSEADLHIINMLDHCIFCLD